MNDIACTPQQEHDRVCQSSLIIIGLHNKPTQTGWLKTIAYFHPCLWFSSYGSADLGWAWWDLAPGHALSALVPPRPAGQPGHHLFMGSTEAKEGKLSHAHLKPLPVSQLLTSHWTNQATWPSPQWRDYCTIFHTMLIHKELLHNNQMNVLLKEAIYTRRFK